MGDATLVTDRSPAGVLAVIALHLRERDETPPGLTLTPDTRLREELALDSLQSFELIAALEDHYELTIPIDELIDVVTLGDVAEIAARLARSDA
jgi:acyl carrier protein